MPRIFFISILVVFLSDSLLQAQQGARRVLFQEVSVYFDFGKSEVRTDARASLDALIPVLEAEPNASVHIEAHTDAIGSDEANHKLSEARALSVKHFLAGRCSNQISIHFEGEQIPVASNDAEDGRQLNRRAKVLLFKTEVLTTAPPSLPKETISTGSQLKGKLIDMDTGLPVKAKLEISFNELKKNEIIDDKFQFSCPNNSLIKIACYAEGYFYRSMEVPIGENEKLEQNIELKPIKVGEQIRINNLFFVGNQAVLLPKSEPELNRLLRFMQLNKNLKIEIQGHINNPFALPGDATPDQVQLSYDRAYMVRQYLIDNNIKKDRMTFKGYGNSKMIFPNARAEEQQRMNRRVEVKVIGI